jgi:hypothetical protein
MAEKNQGLTTKDIVDCIRRSLQENDKAVIKALGILYSYQTKDEQSSEATIYDNGVGFSGPDADFLTSCWKSYLKYNSLTVKQLNIVRKCIVKYSGQLARHAIASGKYVKSSGSSRYYTRSNA